MDMLPKCAANYVPLSPITFLPRAASVYGNHTSLIYGGTRFTWTETYQRCVRLACSLRRSLGVNKNDVVSVLAPNVPALYEMHFAVPMAGAVLNTINTRLDAKRITTILKHSEAKIFFVDYQYMPLACHALELLVSSSLPVVVIIDDIDSPTGIGLGKLEYEQLIYRGDSQYTPHMLDDEWDPIALNYTSGTTSEPKGVVYSHRGSFLSTMSLLQQWNVKNKPVYLWSLPMFHCNGWTFTWGVAARGGTNVCIRSTSAATIYQAIAEHKVTHMCCAPIVFNILLEAASPAEQLPSPVKILTGGAPPPARLVEKIEKLGFNVTHAYGLTEATGPALVCEWQAQWDQLTCREKAKLKARQGISVLSLADADVKELKTMASVRRDGKSMGEIVLRGSSIMKGYFKDPRATAEVFKDGWFLTGDVGVIHPDGYVEIKDRSKDVIISGGENISSIEVESVLYEHPRVLEAALVAMPHTHWGETPCAFITLKKGEEGEVKEDEIISFCKNHLPGFMVPKKVVIIDELPKTATGKIEKKQLRAMAKSFSNPVTTTTTQRTHQSRNQKPQNPVEKPMEETLLGKSRL